MTTGAILNWTRTGSVNCIATSLDVVYGSNREEARQILLNVAADHPRILGTDTRTDRLAIDVRSLNVQLSKNFKVGRKS